MAIKTVAMEVMSTATVRSCDFVRHKTKTRQLLVKWTNVSRASELFSRQLKIYDATKSTTRSSKQINSLCKKKTNNFLSQARVFSIRSSFFMEFFCMEQHFERESKKDGTYPKFCCSYSSWLTKVRSCFSCPERA